MILRSQPWVSVLALFCAVVVLLGGCARKDKAQETRSSISQGPTQDDSASESAQPESPTRSDLPANVRSQEHSSSPDPAKLHQEALLAYETGDENAAFDLGRQAMRLAPNDPQVVFFTARILGDRNRFPEAIVMLDELAENSPDLRLPALGQTAEWLVRFGQWSEAESRYLAILDEVPDFVLVHRNLAQLMRRQGRRIEAARHLGYLCKAGDATEEELRSLLTIVRPFPGDAVKGALDPIGSLGKARNEIAHEDWQTARERLEALDSIRPEEFALWGRICIVQNDFEAAAKWMATTSNSSERHADAWFARGAYAAHQGDHEHAIGCFAETVLRNQTDDQAYFLMSQSLSELNVRKEAAEALHRADLIKQSQTLGADMASSDVREDKKMSELIDLLDQLHRPLEALAWRGVQLAYARTVSSVSPAEEQRILAEIASDRSKELNANQRRATRQFILCGVDLNALRGGK